MRAVQSPATLCTRCVRALPSPKTSCGGDYFKHAQRQRRCLAFAQRAKRCGALWGLLERRGRVVGVPRAPYEDIV